MFLTSSRLIISEAVCIYRFGTDISAVAAPDNCIGFASVPVARLSATL